MRMASVGDNLKATLERLVQAYERAPVEMRSKETPRLVAVSKTKPKEDIIACYEGGQRVFGENYIQELVEKSTDEEILLKCPDIKWRFIGNCQTKNVPKLMKSKNLSAVETVVSEKLADKLQKSCLSSKIEKLDVMIQINSSGEAEKGGVAPESSAPLIDHVLEKCPNLNFVGLMTIGSLEQSLNSSGQNRDFADMIKCRKEIAGRLNVAEDDLELSMGMSGDMEKAVAMGSTSVRVGSKIFGSRNYGKTT